MGSGNYGDDGAGFILVGSGSTTMGSTEAELGCPIRG